MELTTISSDKGERAIKVESVIYSPDLPKYPNTLENRVAYIVNVENMSKEQIMFASFVLVGITKQAP
jgi:hypothetical protein